MTRIFLAAMLSATTALLSTQTFANPVERVLPHGKDGDNYHYQVKCTNGTLASVVVQDTDNTVCAQAFRGERVCKSGWSVQKAAQHACS